MNHQSPVNHLAQSPFVSPTAMTLEDVLSALPGCLGLKPSRVRDLRSAIQKLCRILDVAPDRVPANLDYLRRQLSGLRPAEAGLSARGFTNLKSALRAALVACGCSSKRQDWLRAPSPAWLSLIALIPDKWDRSRFGYFSRYCSVLGIEPSAVTDEVIQGYIEAIGNETFVRDPEKNARDLIDAWNKHRSMIPGWPQVSLTRRPSRRKLWTIPFTQFPTSLQHELATWERRLAHPDPFDEDAPPKALRPGTITYRKFQLQQVASALVLSGFPIGEVTSFAVLVDLANFKGAFRYLLERRNGAKSEQLHAIATGMKAVAKHHVKVSDAQLMELDRICKRLAPVGATSSAKNRTRLEALEDPAALGRLLNLPAELVRLHTRHPQRSDRQSHRAARLLLAAIAIEILLYCPMRIGNLVSLDLDRHIRRIKDRKGSRVLIRIPGEEVKNGRELTYELGPTSTAMLDLYLQKARPVLPGASSTYLFPARNGDHKLPHVMGELIRGAIREHTGLTVNPHLFRSIAGRIHNLASPGDFVTLAHVIGDTIETTMKAYGQHERGNAIRHYQNSVEKARYSLATASRPRRRKPSGEKPSGDKPRGRKP